MCPKGKKMRRRKSWEKTRRYWERQMKKEQNKVTAREWGIVIGIGILLLIILTFVSCCLIAVVKTAYIWLKSDPTAVVSASLVIVVLLIVFLVKRKLKR